jgi:polyisoprenoid-binding protein YceI
MLIRHLLYSCVLASGVCLLLIHRSSLNAEPPAQGAAYQVDTAASRVYVKVGSATAFGHPHGVEGQLKSGKLNFPNAGDLVFDMATYSADTAEARKRVGLDHEKIPASQPKEVTESMRGPGVLDVAHFPTATFEIIAVTPLDRQAPGAPGTYEVVGKLTLHGSAKKLGFKAKLEAGPQQGSMKLGGSFSLKQSDYGIKPYSVFGGVVKVADDLEISGDVLLVPAR